MGIKFRPRSVIELFRDKGYETLLLLGMILQGQEETMKEELQ